MIHKPLACAALAAALLAPGCRSTESGSRTATPASADRRPNIVFIFADDHAYQAVGAYGSVINETPHIDRLADGGMRFDRCLVTNSICGPSRAVILTGKYSHVNGFLRNGIRFDGSQQTFPKLLRQAGYADGRRRQVAPRSTDPQGFDYWKVLIGQGPYYNPPMIDNGTRVEHTGYTTEVITDIALDWLRNTRDPDRPFMLMFQHKAPHRNLAAGPGPDVAVRRVRRSPSRSRSLTTTTRGPPGRPHPGHDDCTRPS